MLPASFSSDLNDPFSLLTGRGVPPHQVVFNRDLVITHMVSPEGESLELLQKIDPKGKNVEAWMLELEDQMRFTVRCWRPFTWNFRDVVQTARSDGSTETTCEASRELNAGRRTFAPVAPRSADVPPGRTTRPSVRRG